MFTLTNLINLISGDVGNSGDAYAWMNYHDPHIATADRDVIKLFFKRCREHKPAMARDKRLARLNAYRDIILIHRKNQALYSSVMKGF